MTLSLVTASQTKPPSPVKPPRMVGAILVHRQNIYVPTTISSCTTFCALKVMEIRPIVFQVTLRTLVKWMDRCSWKAAPTLRVVTPRFDMCKKKCRICGHYWASCSSACNFSSNSCSFLHNGLQAAWVQVNTRICHASTGELNHLSTLLDNRHQENCQLLTLCECALS